MYLLGLALWEFLVDHLLLEDPEGENTHTKPCLAFQCEIILIRTTTEAIPKQRRKRWGTIKLL